MPLKCVVVEVHVLEVGPNTCPGKIAQRVKWMLEGAVVPGLKVADVTGRNCTFADHLLPNVDWWEHVLSKVKPAK